MCHITVELSCCFTILFAFVDCSAAAAVLSTTVDRSPMLATGSTDVVVNNFSYVCSSVL